MIYSFQFLRAVSPELKVTRPDLDGFLIGHAPARAARSQPGKPVGWASSKRLDTVGSWGLMNHQTIGKP